MDYGVEIGTTNGRLAQDERRMIITLRLKKKKMESRYSTRSYIKK